MLFDQMYKLCRGIGGQYQKGDKTKWMTPELNFTDLWTISSGSVCAQWNVIHIHTPSYTFFFDGEKKKYREKTEREMALKGESLRMKLEYEEEIRMMAFAVSILEEKK